MNEIVFCGFGQPIQRHIGMRGQVGVGCVARMFTLVVPVLLASCGWQARNGVQPDAAPSATASGSSTRESIATHTYFGAEFGAQQDVQGDPPVEPRVQAF